MESKNPHAGHRARLRKQVRENGLDSLHEHQALEYLLSFVVPQKDTNVIAHELIKTFGSYSKVFEADLNSLQEVNGVGEVVAHFIFHFRDFFYYYQQNRKDSVQIVKDFTTAKNLVLPLLKHKLVEEVYIICIDAKNNVVAIKKLAKGSVNSASINVRDITEILLNNNVANFLIAHNHPDGRCLPSAEDDKMTKALTIAMALNNIKLMDHLIVGNDGVYSYFHDGKIQLYNTEANRLLNKTDTLIAQRFADYGDD